MSTTRVAHKTVPALRRAGAVLDLRRRWPGWRQGYWCSGAGRHRRPTGDSARAPPASTCAVRRQTTTSLHRPGRQRPAGATPAMTASTAATASTPRCMPAARRLHYGRQWRATLTVRDTTGARGIDTLDGVSAPEVRQQLHWRSTSTAMPEQVAGSSAPCSARPGWPAAGSSGLGLKLLDGGPAYMATWWRWPWHAEFAQLSAGSRSNTDFVRQVYRNVVGSEADAATAVVVRRPASTGARPRGHAGADITTLTSRRSRST